MFMQPFRHSFNCIGSFDSVLLQHLCIFKVRISSPKRVVIFNFFVLYFCIFLIKIQKFVLSESNMAGSSFMGKILESVASTNFGQFVIKTLDLLLWTIEKPAKYCVNGGSNTDTRKLAWPVFWTVLINLQIFRLVFSTILQQFNGNRLETKDIVRCVQKWRRSLRSIRFRGLRKIREEQSKNANGNSGKICDH